MPRPIGAMSGLPQSGQARGTPCAEAAVVAAQRAVELVEDAPGAAVRTGALPAAGAAVQHRRIAAAVEEERGSARRARSAAAAPPRAAGDSACGAAPPLARHGRHVEQCAPRQRAAADARRHRQPRVAALLGALPALERRRGRAEQHGALEPAAVDREVARRVARRPPAACRTGRAPRRRRSAPASAATRTPRAAYPAPGRPARGAPASQWRRRCAGVSPLCSETMRRGVAGESARRSALRVAA